MDSETSMPAPINRSNRGRFGGSDDQASGSDGGWAVMAPPASSSRQGFSTSVTVPYRVVLNISYLTANYFDAKLDVYSRTDAATPQPTLIWIHGGGWTGGNKENKETATFSLLPYLIWRWAGTWCMSNIDWRVFRRRLRRLKTAWARFDG